MAQNLTIYNRYINAGSSSNQIYQDCINAGSSSQDATETAYPTNTAPSNTGYVYKSSVTSVKTYSTATYASLNPTSPDLHTRGQVRYHITSSATIPGSVCTFTTSSLGLGPANTTAKIAIPVSYLTPSYNSNINDANDVRGLNILSYNGVISTLTQYNSFSSSIDNGVTSNYVIMYVSASKNSMGAIANGNLNLTLGRTQLPTGPTGRVRAIAEAVEEFPGGGSGAVTFDGISQYFTAPNANVVNWLPGTGDFTIEWFMKKGVGGTSFPRVFSLGFNTQATIGVSIEGGTCYVWPYGSGLSGAMPAGYEDGSSWTHIAICRSGTTTKLFIDGTLVKTKTSDSRDIADSINPGFDLNVGVDDPTSESANWFSGKVTNFRWDNSAIYTGASLTVPTAPLAKTATTKLLMLGGGSTNPVYDAAKLNTLVNHGSVWDADTPFV